MTEIQFWFTEEDKELMGAHSTRDPLGFYGLWSQRGRAVIRNMTEQTTDARGFQLLVSALLLFERFEAQHPDVRIRVEEFFMLVEQAFAFSTFARTGRWPLAGSERVAIFTREDARLSLK